jgi:hypothetical protein
MYVHPELHIALAADRQRELLANVGGPADPRFLQLAQSAGLAIRGSSVRSFYVRISLNRITVTVSSGDTRRL